MSSDSTLDSTEGQDGPLMAIRNLKKHFNNDAGLIEGFQYTKSFPPIEYSPELVRAVDDVSLNIHQGEVLGLVGESGCGKSTLARTILQLETPTEGEIQFKGEDLTELSKKELRRRRSDIQMIFQDPQSSLNPRLRVGKIVEEPMKAHGMYDKETRKERAKELLEKVGLDSHHYNRYPHAFSGGQRQRVNLARALSVDPDFIVCDEPVSSLDVSIQAGVLNVLKDLQEEFDLTLLFIAHDLSVIRYICDRVAVMYLGQIVEVAEKEELFENPQHPYTRSLLDSIPSPDPTSSEVRANLEGDVPSPISPPTGCRFRTRCPELIPPEEFNLTDEAWEDVVTFARRVKSRQIATRESNEIWEQFFAAVDLPKNVADIVDEIIEGVVDTEWEEADSILDEKVLDRSPCAIEPEQYQIIPEYGDGTHRAACHLNRD